MFIFTVKKQRIIKCCCFSIAVVSLQIRSLWVILVYALQCMSDCVNSDVSVLFKVWIVLQKRHHLLRCTHLFSLTRSQKARTTSNSFMYRRWWLSLSKAHLKANKSIPQWIIMSPESSDSFMTAVETWNFAIAIHFILPQNFKGWYKAELVNMLRWG